MRRDLVEEEKKTRKQCRDRLIFKRAVGYNLSNRDGSVKDTSQFVEFTRGVQEKTETDSDRK